MQPGGTVADNCEEMVLVYVSEQSINRSKNQRQHTALKIAHPKNLVIIHLQTKQLIITS
jgi:hypothetical protein